MKVPYVAQGNVRTPDQTRGYLRPAVPDYSGLTQGLSAFAAGIKTASDKRQAETDKLNGYKATTAFIDFQTEADAKLLHLKRDTPIDAANVEERLNGQYNNYEKEFIAKINEIDPTLVPKFTAEAAATRSKYYGDHAEFARTQRDTYYKVDIAKGQNEAKIKVGENPTTLREQKELMKARIEAADLSEAQRLELHQANDQQLETIAYGKRAEQQLTYGHDLRTSIIAASKELGVSPQDLATVISYETGGKFSTSIYGGAGGRHLGLIQFGPTEQAKYGAKAGQTPQEQMRAVVAYLKDRGFKPGMGLMDLYSTINAGSPGRFNASDANNGGAPGTVADKVLTQMEGHKKKAAELLGGTYTPPDELDADPDFQNVSYEDRVAARKDAQVRVDAMLTDQARQQKEHYSAFVESTKEGVYTGEIGRRELEDMLTKQELEFNDFSAAMEVYNKRVADGKDAREGFAKLARGVPFSADDPDDIKQADAMFTDELDDNLRKGDEAAQDTVTNFAGQTGIIPPKAVDSLSAVASGPDIPKKMRALDVLAKLEDASNYAYNKQVPAPLREQVDRYNVLKSVLPTEELLAAISPGYTVEQRQAKDQLEKIFNQEMAKAQPMFSFDQTLQSFDPGFLSGQPVDMNYGPAVTSMHSQWLALMKYNWVKTNGNAEATLAITNKQLARTWGNTDIGGKRKLMAYPVEKFVKTVDGTHEWVDQQIVMDFKLPPNTKYELVSDHETENAIANPVIQGFAKSNELKPTTRQSTLSYKIAVEKDGVWSLLPGRYAPQITPVMRAEETRRAEVKQDVKLLEELYAQYANAKHMEEAGKVPMPPQLLEDIKALEEKIKVKTEELKVPAKQGPIYEYPGTTTKPFDPRPGAAAAEEKIRNFFKSIGETAKVPKLKGHWEGDTFIADETGTARPDTRVPDDPDMGVPMMPGYWAGGTFYSDEDRIPEGAAVMNERGEGYIKRNGKLVKQ